MQKNIYCHSVHGEYKLTFPEENLKIHILSLLKYKLFDTAIELLELYFREIINHVHKRIYMRINYNLKNTSLAYSVGYSKK